MSRLRRAVPWLRVATVQRIHAAMVHGADQNRCRAALALLPADLTVHDKVMIAAQVLADGIRDLPQSQQAEAMTGLFSIATGLLGPDAPPESNTQ